MLPLIRGETLLPILGRIPSLHIGGYDKDGRREERGGREDGKKEEDKIVQSVSCSLGGGITEDFWVIPRALQHTTALSLKHTLSTP